jgi:hypothetical protein
MAMKQLMEKPEAQKEDPLSPERMNHKINRLFGEIDTIKRSLISLNQAFAELRKAFEDSRKGQKG